MDFAQLPPEINSGLLYTGPGALPMAAAAAGWQSLAAELQSTTRSFGALIDEVLSGPWRGASTAAMVASGIPQVEWLSAAAERAEQAASQALSAAAAFEAAFTATVPPPEVALNRATVLALNATNLLGQNNAAIAALEAQYAEMWAQDAAAMYGYANAAATAAALSPFPMAPPTIDIKGVVSQMETVTQAVKNAALPTQLHDIPKALSKLAGITNEPPWLKNPAGALGLNGHMWNSNGDGIILNGFLGDVFEGLTGSQTLDGSSGFDVYTKLISPIRLSTTASKDIESLAESMTHFAPKAIETAAKAAEAAPAALGNALGNVGASLGSAAASAGHALPIGHLSVPASWAAAAPVQAGQAATSLVSTNGLQVASAAEPAINQMGGMPMMGMGNGRGFANFVAPRYGFKPTVMPGTRIGG